MGLKIKIDGSFCIGGYLSHFISKAVSWDYSSQLVLDTSDYLYRVKS